MNAIGSERRGRLAGGRAVGARPPLWLLVPAVIVALAMLLPIAYLVIRAAGTPFWELVSRPRTLAVLGRTLYLALAVAAASIAIAVPLA